jgi:hypothetical protein
VSVPQIKTTPTGCTYIGKTDEIKVKKSVFLKEARGLLPSEIWGYQGGNNEE